MKKILITLILLLFLTACFQISYITFTGEGENWYAKQEVSQFDKRQETKLLIRYIGENLEEVRNATITYSFVGKGSNKGTMPLNKEGVLETSGAGCEGCAFLTEKDEIFFEIEWGNGNKESFILKLNK